VRVDEIMQTDLVSCDPTATVVEAAATMCARRVGACLVMEGPRLVGIFTERDLLRVFAAGDDVRERTVGDLMTRNVTMAPPDADVIWAADTMKRIRARHLPVGEDGMVAGIISLRDLFAMAEAVLRLDPDGAATAREMLAAASGRREESP
jgi:CBS domain-containing protein